ncbi:magnesium transporter NIPA-domain-containing protein [Halteromyces radiatus]|uniref:magnesium transporter NIPA-domain-containing protein n=1 Tax=Halteromyces radiatus TaxID=101107 RepID=UPI00221EFC98|nr:magnesium transporter NIPA-domain-containing protein [Halteromyces radiatus]KAI8092535.1 magnesium transporter NIPA-domain-containing protein [Halteromyces radiatus]
MTQALGISLQRRSHLEQPTTGSFRKPLWVTGFLIYTVSNLVASTCTIAFLPIVVLALLGSIGLVFNAIFARLVLGDPFTSRTIIGTTLIVAGAMLVAGFGVVPEPNHTLQDLIQLYKRPSFIIYFALVEFCICFGLILTHLMEYGLERNTQWQIKYPDLKMWLGISFGVFGANISSQAMLFAKSGLELLILTVFHGENQFIYPLTWVIVIALIFTAVLQLYYLNRGVQLCDTIILVPLNFCSFNVSCLFNGLVYYNQWDRLYWWQVVLVLAGIVILVWGVLIISFNTTTSFSPSSDISTKTSHSPPPVQPHVSSSLASDHPVWQKLYKRIHHFFSAKLDQRDETTPLLPAT